MKAIDEKTTKYKDANPGMDVEKPKKATVSNRVRRNILDPERHRLEGAARGPNPALADLEDLMLAFVEEAAEVGIFMNLKEVAQKMADLMHDTPVGDAFADFAAMSRGVKDEDGNFVLKAEDYEPGATWAKNFLKRHAERIARVLPTALDTTREKWQTVDNFAWWYHCLACGSTTTASRWTTWATRRQRRSGPWTR